MLAAGINTYQDRRGIQRTIESLYDHVDLIIVVDGRYPEWGNENLPKFSTDGTKEYCSTLDKVEYHELFADQKTKRTKYMQETKKHNCDLILVIDSDDFVHGTTNWKKFEDYIDYGLKNNTFEKQRTLEFQQIYNVEFIMTPERRQYIGRLFYKPYELKYISHWRIEKNRMQMKYPRFNMNHVPGLVMSSNDLMRSHNRIPVDVEYQWNLLYREHSISEQEYKSITRKRIFEQEIYNEVYVWKDYFKEQDIVNPLLCLTSPRDIKEVMDGLGTIIDCDKLIIKYHHTTRTYRLMRRYFLSHPEYTHLIVQPDDLVATIKHYNAIKNDVIANNYHVISGVCNCTVNDNRLAMDIDQLPERNRKLREYHYPPSSRVKGIVKVFWAGFPFSWIRRDVVERIEFEDDSRFNPSYTPNQGWATDVMFHNACFELGIPVFADCNVSMKHLKGHEIYEGFNIKTGIEEPKVYLVPKLQDKWKDITNECYEKHLEAGDKIPFSFMDPQTGRHRMI